MSFLPAGSIQFGGSLEIPLGGLKIKFEWQKRYVTDGFATPWLSVHFVWKKALEVPIDKEEGPKVPCPTCNKLVAEEKLRSTPKMTGVFQGCEATYCPNCDPEVTFRTETT